MPARTVKNFETVMPRSSKLVMISGESFHREMGILAQTLSETEISQVFLDRPDLRHHWASGWVEKGLRVLLGEND